VAQLLQQAWVQQQQQQPTYVARGCSKASTQHHQQHQQHHWQHLPPCCQQWQQLHLVLVQGVLLLSASCSTPKWPQELHHPRRQQQQ
jgi:hypothetical protein